MSDVKVVTEVDVCGTPTPIGVSDTDYIITHEIDPTTGENKTLTEVLKNGGGGGSGGGLSPVFRGETLYFE